MINFRRQIIELEELMKEEKLQCCPPVVPAGQVSLDWAGTEGRPIVIVVPGLTGDSSSAYVRRLVDQLVRANFHVACFNPRGRGGNILKSPLLYSVGYTEDLRRVVALVRGSFAASVPLFAVGFSLGSNYLAKYMGEEGAKCSLDGGVCIACPIDCTLMSYHLCASWIGKYLMDPLLLGFVQKAKEQLRPMLSKHSQIDLALVAQARNMKEFDHYAIAPMFGFSCASDYYRFSSAGLYLSRIRRPTLFLHAANDPIIPGDKISLDNFKSNPWLLSAMTAEGGHSMDFPSGLSLESWSSEVACEFVAALI
jgi:predicted alpha/beta-fold hydrolase